MSIKTHIDHLGREVVLGKTPKRIISLVPSQTELLIDLGLENQLVGITNYCIHPSGKVIDIQKIGGTKTPKTDIIKALKPDIIIANKEENNFKDIEELAKDIPVWLSDVNTFEDNYKLIKDLGSLFNKLPEATAICSEIKRNWENVRIDQLRSCIYFIWRKPYMVIGTNTFINSVLDKSGFDNLITESRYPSLSELELVSLEPEIVFLSSEPYAFKEKHIYEFRKIFPHAIIKIVDGELFSWYGPRQKLLPAYISDLKKSL